jgi:hypothetical protein
MGSLSPSLSPSPLFSLPPSLCLLPLFTLSENQKSRQVKESWFYGEIARSTGKSMGSGSKYITAPKSRFLHLWNERSWGKLWRRWSSDYVRPRVLGPHWPFPPTPSLCKLDFPDAVWSQSQYYNIRSSCLRHKHYRGVYYGCEYITLCFI